MAAGLGTKISWICLHLCHLSCFQFMAIVTKLCSSFGQRAHIRSNLVNNRKAQQLDPVALATVWCVSFQAVARWAAAVALGVAERLRPATTSVPSVSGGGRVVAVSTGGPRGASGYRSDWEGYLRGPRGALERIKRILERAKRGAREDQEVTGHTLARSFLHLRPRFWSITMEATVLAGESLFPK